MTSEVEKAIFINIINNDDLTKYKRKERYFQNENLNNIFNTIVKLYFKEKKVITDTNTIVNEMNNEISNDIVNMIMKYDISNYDIKWLNEQTDKYITEKFTRLEVKKMVSEISNPDLSEWEKDEVIKKIAERLNVKSDLINDLEAEKKDSFNTPFINNEVYNNLPKLLKNITLHFDKREKDMVLLSSLSVFSVLFDTAYIRWKTDKERSNLMLFIGAKASSGKSKMKYAKMLLNSIIKDEKEQNKLIKFNAENTKEYPIYKNILIPANSSAAAFEEKLNNNDGKGLIFTTEASEIGKNKKQDWGDYDTMLRKAFHNETIDSNRKGSEVVCIENSFVSTCISGTFDQLVEMFENKSENGLFSRFMFYLFDNDSIWIKDNGLRFQYNDKNDLEAVFNAYSIQVNEMYKHYQNNEIEVDLTPEQCNLFDNEMEKLDSYYYALHGENIKGSMNRIAVIARKIMIILTLIRSYENVSLFNDFDKLMVNNYDFDIAISLAKTLLEHTSLILNSFDYNNVNKKATVIKNDSKAELFNSMNNEFTFAEMKEKGLKNYDMQPKTIQRFLRDLVDKKVIKQLSKGHYRKI